MENKWVYGLKKIWLSLHTFILSIQYHIFPNLHSMSLEFIWDIELSFLNNILVLLLLKEIRTKTFYSTLEENRAVIKDIFTEMQILLFKIPPTVVWSFTLEPISLSVPELNQEWSFLCDGEQLWEKAGDFPYFITGLGRCCENNSRLRRACCIFCVVKSFSTAG